MWLYKIPFWLDISDTLLLSFALSPHCHHHLHLWLSIEWDGTVACCNTSKPLLFSSYLSCCSFPQLNHAISFFFHSSFTLLSPLMFFTFHIYLSSFHVFYKAALESHAILLTFPSRLVSST